MSEMEKAYQPAEHEAGIYKMWEESGAFKPGGDPTKEPFSIIMPPPNANGNLHTGHAMFVVEDILTRYNRMQQRPTLWLPGTDHAGIETQVVFERELAKEGRDRFDLGPEAFYKEVFDYSKKNQTTIISQLKSLGFSADWSRLKFTLDEDIVETVNDTFKLLLDDGLIYRGNRIVNWCPRCNAAFADIEIKHRDQIDPLYYIKYGPFVVATVRPETMFGDTAIAVHPDDERYQKYIGKEARVQSPIGSMNLLVIGDKHVNPEFGTGVVKVTPAHDPNDWEMSERHKLEVKQVIGTDGRLTDLAGKFTGMKSADARQQVAKDLEAMGLMDHIEMDYSHSIAYHDRCGTVIEPLVTEQWWVKVKPLAQRAIEAVEKGDIEIIPGRFKKVYIDWLKNLKDWNISRQIWWGIRIPIAYNATPDNGKDPYRFVSRETDAEKYYGKNGYEMETDTFDTWFSSSQWPFATLMATGDYDQFYPTSVMETGRDILFQWVSRMVMLGLYRTDKVPFRTVYLHGLVNDEHGKKMSKSKGNVINPLDKTSEYGTDALRLALTIGITPGNDGALGDNKIAGYRNFCNKLWNVARFILDKADGYSPTPPEAKTLADRWILSTVSRETNLITEAIEQYRFSEAGERVYSLLWNDFADWYIEASKGKINLPVLINALESLLKLAHPFAPFVTEAIWQNMPWQKDNLIVSRWPEANQRDKKAEADFEIIMALVSQIRSMSQDLKAAKPTVLYQDSQLITENADLIQRLAKVGELKVGEGSGLRIPVAGVEAWLDVSRETVVAYRQSLEHKRDEAGDYANRLVKQLANKSYTESAPAHLVQETRDRAEETNLLLSQLDEQISSITE